MQKFLVTGATGLMGANVCEDLRKQGREVRAIVRNTSSSDCRALEELGVEIVPGDLSDMRVVMKATEGVDASIHCAAMLGGPHATITEGFASNVMGTLTVLTSAWKAGNIPVVQVLSTPFFDTFGGKTLTENAKLDLELVHDDPYAITKRLGFVEGLARVQAGQDIRFVIPGGIYGPSPCPEKANGVTSFNGAMLDALNGRLKALPDLMVTYSYSKDCSAIAIGAIDNGETGKVYIAHGAPQDDCTFPAFCNLVCEMAGIAPTVGAITKEKSYNPKIIEIFGEHNTVLRMLREEPARPLTDSSITQKALGVPPTTLAEGIPATLDWFRNIGVMPN